MTAQPVFFSSGSDPAPHSLEAVSGIGVEADAGIGCEPVHEIEDLLEQQQPLAGLPQPCADQDAIEFMIVRSVPATAAA
jgi:hypothetical protein